MKNNWFSDNIPIKYPGDPINDFTIPKENIHYSKEIMFVGN